MLTYEPANSPVIAIKESKPMKSKSKPVLSTISALFDETVSLKNSRDERGIANGEHESWFKLIQVFRGKVANDQKYLARHELAGRSLLYSQLADAYKIGLELINDCNSDESAVSIHDFRALRHLLKKHSLHKGVEAISVISRNNRDRIWNEKNPERPQRDLKPEISLWVYIVKLLYGKWIDSSKWTDIERQENGKKVGLKTDEVGDFVFHKDAPDEAPTVYQAWSPNRSAEKYAVVFRYLQEQGVAVADVPAFIDGFNHKEFGKKLLGIERAGRAAASQGGTTKPKSQDVIDKEKSYVRRAEARTNEKVFAFEKPGMWPSKTQYARAVVKIDGEELVIVGFTEMTEAAYVSHAVSIGKPLAEQDAKDAAERQDQIDAATPAAKSVVNGVTNFAAEALADGDDADEIRADMDAYFKARAAKRRATKAITGFAIPDPN